MKKRLEPNQPNKSQPRGLFFFAKNVAMVLMVAIGFLVVWNLVSTNKAHAELWSAIPTSVQNEIWTLDNNPGSQCNSAGVSGYFPWLSTNSSTAQDGSALDPILVPYGYRSSTTLLFNDLNFICWDAVAGGAASKINFYTGQPDVPTDVSNYNQPLPDPPGPWAGDYLAQNTSTYVDSTYAPGGITSGLSGGISSICFQSGTRFWFRTAGCGGAPYAMPFSFTPSAPITTTTTFDIQVTITPTNSYQYQDGTWHYFCVYGGAPATSGQAPGARQIANGLPCPSGTLNFYMTFKVDSPMGNVEGGSCTANVTGWALQQDDPGASIPVDVYEVGASPDTPLPGFGAPGGNGGGIGRFPTNVYRPDVDAYFRVSGVHGFSINLQPYDGPVAHTFYFYAIGQPPDTNAYIGRITIGPCASPPTINISPPTCSAVTFSANDPTLPSDPISATSVTNQRTGGRATLTSRSGNNFTYNISAWRGYSSETFTVSATDSGGTSTKNFSVGPCASFSCSSFATNPASPVSGQSFQLTTFINDVGTGPDGAPPGGGGSYTITLNGNNYSPGYSANGLSTVSSNPLGVTLGVGTYTVHWSFTYNGVSSGSCSGTISVFNEPYLQVVGGDVSVGNGFAPSCANGGANAGISAWNNGAGGAGNKGAGSEFAVHAIGPIDGFASSQVPSVSSAPNGLSFANTSGTYGGNFGTTTCDSDYYSGHIQASAYGPGSLSNGGAYYDNESGGTLTLNNVTIPNKKQSTLYVNGSVYITGNGVKYAGPGGGAPNNITSFNLIVSGNIYINSNVSELAGSYIAQSGTIYTCSDGGGNFQGVLACGKQLTVNGAFAAKNIKFWRTYGTNSSGGSGMSSQAPAELFNYTPNVWLAEPTSPKSTIDSVTNLPPVL